jgi:hypothetical protein
VSLVRDILTAGSQKTFEELLARFNRDGGPYREAAAVRPSLQAAFNTLQGEQHPVDFWDAHPDKCGELSDLGLSAERIAIVVDEELEEVNTRLSQREREPVPVP